MRLYFFKKHVLNSNETIDIFRSLEKGCYKGNVDDILNSDDD
jgi:hypothetical protein